MPALPSAPASRTITGCALALLAALAHAATNDIVIGQTIALTGG